MLEKEKENIRKRRMVQVNSSRNDPFINITMLICLPTIVGSSLYGVSLHELVERKDIAPVISALIAVALTIGTINLLKKFGLTHELNGFNSKLSYFLLSMLFLVSFFIFTQTILKDINIRFDRSKEIIEDYIVKEKHHYVRHSKDSGTSHSYCIDIKKPDGTGEVRTISLEDQAQLDQFENGDKIGVGTKAGCLGRAYYTSVILRKNNDQKISK